jgi:hypothetical protein
VDRYSFPVRLLPPLLHAGLSRRTNISIALKISLPNRGGRTDRANLRYGLIASVNSGPTTPMSDSVIHWWDSERRNCENRLTTMAARKKSMMRSAREPKASGVSLYSCMAG